MQVGSLPLLIGTYRQKVLWLTPLVSDSVSRGMDSDESQFKRTLGATILEFRVGHGLRSQKALALAVGVSEATVRRWEKGSHAPDAWEINRMCALFGIEPSELIQPEPMTDREREVLRRAARQVHRTLDQDDGASSSRAG